MAPHSLRRAAAGLVRVEYSNGATGWAMVFVVAGLYAAYELLFMYDHTMKKAEAKAEAERARIAAEAERADAD